MLKDFKHPKVMTLKQYLQEMHDKEIELEMTYENNEFKVPEKLYDSINDDEKVVANILKVVLSSVEYTAECII